MTETITLAYTSNAGVSYQIEFDRFSDDEIPRRIIGQTNIEFAALGTAYATGPTVKQPKIWSINALVNNAVTSKALKNSTNYNEARLITELYDAWDTDRANGLAARCVISDNIFTFGSTYAADGWFTEPPSFSVVGNYGSNIINVILGLTEV
jgi:hypothetical protein